MSENKAERKAKKAESFVEFMRRIERAHIDRDVVAVEATHPDAPTGTWAGTFSGIRTTKGKPSVKYSDGTTE